MIHTTVQNLTKSGRKSNWSVFTPTGQLICKVTSKRQANHLVNYLNQNNDHSNLQSTDRTVHSSAASDTGSSSSQSGARSPVTILEQTIDTANDFSGFQSTGQPDAGSSSGTSQTSSAITRKAESTGLGARMGNGDTGETLDNEYDAEATAELFDYAKQAYEFTVDRIANPLTEIEKEAQRGERGARAVAFALGQFYAQRAAGKPTSFASEEQIRLVLNPTRAERDAERARLDKIIGRGSEQSNLLSPKRDNKNKSKKRA